jgi:hypothetical protein
MGQHVKDYFSQFCDDTPQGHFHKVTALNDHPEISWEALAKTVPNMCKGWFELSRLSPQDRIEFTCDFWLAKLPYHPKCSEFIERFFANLEDIGVFITQQKFDDPLEAHLVYVLKNDSGFFKGRLPASEQELSDLQKAFPEYILPKDYFAFLQIHNGFCKTTDCTGIMPSTYMESAYNNFISLISEGEVVTTNSGTLVEHKKLIPFYESFGMPFYQCFWAEWYPEDEMGNVYYSGMTMTISDVDGVDPSSETMAFPTFTDWLMFYMERII